MLRRPTRTIRREEISKAPVCAACGAVASREYANYCLVCGKTLKEDYQPLDSLRSSNRLQGRSFLMENTMTPVAEDIFEINRNAFSETAWASCVYSMVPYVGIVFIPFTIFSAFIGIGVSFKNPAAGGAKLSAASLGLSVLVFGIQLFLWWLLYIIPELGRSI